MDHEEMGWGTWTVLARVRIGTGGGHLWMRWWTYGFHKMWGISWFAGWLFSKYLAAWSYCSPLVYLLLTGDQTRNNHYRVSLCSCANNSLRQSPRGHVKNISGQYRKWRHTQTSRLNMQRSWCKIFYKTVQLVEQTMLNKILEFSWSSFLFNGCFLTLLSIN